MEPMMDSKFLGQTGTFFIFGVISILGAIWCCIYLKETSGGLTDKEKKSLYIPEDIQKELRMKSDMDVDRRRIFGADK